MGHCQSGGSGRTFSAGGPDAVAASFFMASIENTAALEFRVGLFVLVGLAMIGYMVVEFGRFGTGLKSAYEVTVELPNASGLLKNSKVLLAGATVGTVADAPQVLTHARGVAVQLKIFRPIQIPRNAQVVVGSSGLLGDRFVDVITKPQDAGGYYQPGETIRGSRESGMDDLTREGGLLVADLRATVANLNGTITRINQGLLKDQAFKDLQDSLAHLNAATKNFQTTSEKLNGVVDAAHGVVDRAGGAVDAAKDTMGSAKTAADDLQGAIGDARKVLGSFKNVADEAVHGHGLIATLISDREFADNVSALVANLRRSGVLFYKDRPAPAPGQGDGAAERNTPGHGARGSR
jgi:phospholipid/cholesterol/gamma-HCH transport system substrate-binding protein